MFALRNLSRAAPRSVARLSTKAARPQASLFRQTAAFQPASWSKTVPRLTASFHNSAARREANTNDELVLKLQSEIAIEENTQEDEDLSTNIREYLENTPFKLEDKAGSEEVVLTRTYGDEQIRVMFSIADINATDPDEVADNAMYDADVDSIADGQSGGANTKGAMSQGQTADGNVRVAPGDRNAPADREELEDEYDVDGQEPGIQTRVTVRIERPGKGALRVLATVQDGDVMVEDVSHFTSTELADTPTAENHWISQRMYSGPPFNNLDEDLQLLIEKYLEERGVNTRLALFIPDYIDHKEQKEYVRWLNNLKSFVE